MFSFTVLATLLASATAFAPVARRASSSVSLKMGFENEIGALPPVGFWDPLGLVADGDQEKFNFYREVELKHGRVSMLAVAGYLVQESYRLPGTIDYEHTFASIPNGVAAIGAVPSLGWLQIVALVGFWELIGWEDRKGPGIGNYQFGDFAINNQPEAKQNEMKTKEIQNGRLAMLAIMELITHDIAKPAGEGLFVLHHL